LKDQANTPNPLTIGEYMMAAPDVDRDMYRIDAPQVRKITSGMTLYASSTDKALMVSREVFGDVPRAGGVTTGGPIVLPQIDSIDVTEVGNDILGLDHDVFAGTRAVMDDISVLLTTKPRRPPDQRLAEIRGMPEGAVPPAYWRYVP
jgi:esterase/lipase superfamily enzyme